MVSIGILYPGSMGSSLIRYLSYTSPSAHSYYTNLNSRSPRTRSLSADLISSRILTDLTSDDTLLEACDIIISVLVNDVALPVVKSFSDISKSRNVKVKTKYFVDLNALSPATAEEQRKCFEGTNISFVDGGIIGGPASIPRDEGGVAKDGYCPLLVISGEKAGEVKELLGGFGERLKIVGDEVGQASALKLAYASMTKGFLAIGVNSVILASKFNVLDHLHTEMSSSQTAALKQLKGGLQNSLSKAFRWHGEMDEIASAFQAVGLAGGADMFKGAAETYRSVSKTEVGKESVEEQKKAARGWKESIDILERDMSIQ